MIKSLYPKEMPAAAFHALMLGTVGPRPIAFASTVDLAGNINLSPFSFFNCFGSNPPILAFSPARRVRDNTTKHTLENVYEVPEVAINMVNYSMVEQMSLASTEYEKGVNEFEKAGFTQAASVHIRPPRVAEAPASYECKVVQIMPLGSQGGAGNLIICEVLMVHVKEEILDEAGRIDPFKIDLVARMGGDWYCRANGNALFEVAKPLTRKGIGVDQLPPHIRHSKVLTGNNLGKLGNTEHIPLPQDLAHLHIGPEYSQLQGHALAKQLLDDNKLMEAWKVLLTHE